MRSTPRIRGADAISLTAERTPDAVFLDIGLPGKNGYDIAREIREMPALARTTLIAFTGYGNDEDRRRVREAGFDHHLVKPAATTDLARVLDTLPPETSATRDVRTS